MKFSVELVDTYDRESLVYEIWENSNHIAEVYSKDGVLVLDVFCKDKVLNLDFRSFLKILNKINDDI